MLARSTRQLQLAGVAGRHVALPAHQLPAAAVPGPHASGVRGRWGHGRDRVHRDGRSGYADMVWQGDRGLPGHLWGWGLAAGRQHAAGRQATAQHTSGHARLMHNCLCPQCWGVRPSVPGAALGAPACTHQHCHACAPQAAAQEHNCNDKQRKHRSAQQHTTGSRHKGRQRRAGHTGQDMGVEEVMSVALVLKVAGAWTMPRVRRVWRFGWGFGFGVVGAGGATGRGVRLGR